MIKLFVNNTEEVKFEITVFPDGTSQVWKLDKTIFHYDEDVSDPTILWMFESEAEVLHIAQLASLVKRLTKCGNITLKAPYLPYGRQDKNIRNDLSFSLHIITQILSNCGITGITTFDAHSSVDTHLRINSISPENFHYRVLNHDLVVFPDRGAELRYTYSLGGAPSVYFEKVRDQATGEITQLKLIGQLPTTTDKVLIVDDICDGGMTFIKVAKALKELGVGQIDLAVSHGLFSKGKDVLYSAGISNIYTTNSLLRNKEDFNIL